MSTNPRVVGTLAFYGANVALSNLLSETYPTGCTLAQAVRWAAAVSPETVRACEVLK